MRTYAVHPDARWSFTALCGLHGVDPRRALNMNHPAHASVANLHICVIHLYPPYQGEK